MEKTRDISKVNYFELLQREYVSADLRRKVYFKPSDKKYWKKIAEYKKDKISSLSKELSLDSVFTCDEVKLKFLTELSNEGGRPKFQYKDDGSDLSLERTDLLNYYKADSDIKDLSTGKLGKIIASTDSQILDLGEVIIEVNSVKKIVKLEEIVRVV